MSRLCNSNTDYLSSATTSVTTPPFTFFCWAKFISLGAVQQLFNVGVVTNNNHWGLSIDSASETNMLARDATTNSTATSTIAVTDTTNWWAIGGTSEADNDRVAYLQGGNSANNVVTRIPSAPSFMYIGTRPDVTATANAYMAHVAVWNVALTAEEMRLLTCYTPNLIRPASLVDYWDLIADGTTFTSTGTAATVMTPTGTKFSLDNPQFAPAWPYGA